MSSLLITTLYSAMVWTIRNGYRYFENKSEYEVNRMFRIRGNNEAMVESG